MLVRATPVAASDSNLRVPSPCVRNCCLDQDDVCLGCFRTLQEITAWSSSDPDAQRKIIANAEQRRREREKNCR